LGDTGAGQHRLVAPQDVRAVDVRRYRVDLAADRQVADEARRERVGQTPVPVLRAEILDLAGVDVVGQLGTGVSLERPGRWVLLHRGGRPRFGVGAGAAGDRAVDELFLAARGVDHAARAVESGFPTAVGPPGEPLDVFGCRTASVTAAARGRGEEG